MPFVTPKRAAPMSALGQKRTFAVQQSMSAKGQKQTCAVQEAMSALGHKQTSSDYSIASSARPISVFGTLRPASVFIALNEPLMRRRGSPPRQSRSSAGEADWDIARRSGGRQRDAEFAEAGPNRLLDAADWMMTAASSDSRNPRAMRSCAAIRT